MALKAQHKEIVFGVGDTIRIQQKIIEGKKERAQIFEGIVIAIKGHGTSKSFTVRRIGAQKIGIERIFPLNTPSIEKISVIRKGLPGVRRSKLYYIRQKSAREIDKIYRRSSQRIKAKEEVKKAKPEKKTAKKKGKESVQKTTGKRSPQKKSR